MGNCFTSCFPVCGSLCNFNIFSEPKGDFSILIKETASVEDIQKSSFLSRLFERRKNRQKKQSTRMVQSLLNPHLSYHRLESQRAFSQRDIQLQCLDASALLGRTAMSTPENSIDLEWEHETVPVSIAHEPSRNSWATSIFPEDTFTTQPQHSLLHNGATGTNMTDSDYSRISSSANSLEWDSVQNSIHSEGDTIDTDTQFLLNEIDRLTLQALKETGTIMDDVSYLDDTLL